MDVLKDLAGLPFLIDPLWLVMTQTQYDRKNDN